MRATSPAAPSRSPRGPALVRSILVAGLALALLALPATRAAASGGDESEEGDTGPVYSLSADAAAGFILAADGPDLATADSAALWRLTGNFLHRVAAPGWGLVLNHELDLSGQAAVTPAFSLALTIHEAYLRLDLARDGVLALFAGKRRMGLGLGGSFAPGDAINPRTGFWDQKSGFRGLDLEASLGSELAIKGALSLERSFDAYAAALRAKAADAAALAERGAGKPTVAIQGAATAADKAYAEALDGAAGPADPRLITGALSAEAQLGALQVAASGAFRPEALGRASLGAGFDLGGLILQAEGAAEFLADGASPESPNWYGTLGARYAFVGDPLSLTLALDYDYNGAPGDLLKRTHYLIPLLVFSWTDVLDLTCRALVELEAPSALVSGVLALHPRRDADLELSLLAGLGDPGSGGSRDATALPSLVSAGSGNLAIAAGLAVRVHF